MLVTAESIWDISCFISVLMGTLTCKAAADNRRHFSRRTSSASFLFWGRRHQAKPLNPPPPACRGQGVPDAFANSDYSCWFCRLQSLSGDPASAADPSLKLPGVALFRSSVSNSSDFRPNFCRSKFYQKSYLSKNLPKHQKSDPWTPDARFWSHFGRLLASLLHSFFSVFLKMRKLCFWTTV
jgi:hypothetical protein